MPLARAGTEEEAANLALAHLRQPPIAQFSDANSRARACRTFFAAARDRALRQEWWNFATGWNTPAQAAGKIHPSDLKKIYPLPAGCLKVRFVEGLSDDEWAVENYAADPAGSDAEIACLITNAAAPNVCFTKIVDNPRLWDAEFLLAFSFDLAELVGPQIGASTARVKMLREQAREEKDTAAKSDAQEKAGSEVSRETSWLASRRIGYR